ncbi:MAG: hypothetical protein L6Q84_20015 [Polyangiaceae bacterium]|nr:hypothetical protein [Polyangiaceae bacterium]
MSSVQVKNVPRALHAKLRRYARARGQTVREFVLEAVRRDVERMEFRERLAARQPVDLGRRAAVTLDEERSARDAELER